MPNVVVKATRAISYARSVAKHVNYIGFRSRESNNKGLFGPDKDNENGKEFTERVLSNKALQHSKSIKVQKLIFSLQGPHYEQYKRSGKDYKDIVRKTLIDYENKHKVKLDWVANIHDQGEAESHPHCHVAIKGVSDLKGERGYARIKFTRDDLSDFRESFQREFDDGRQAHLHEKLADVVKDNMNDIAKGFEAVTRNIERDAKIQDMKYEQEKAKAVEKIKRESDNEIDNDRKR